jgi:hypothetical protein
MKLWKCDPYVLDNKGLEVPPEPWRTPYAASIVVEFS